MTVLDPDTVPTEVSTERRFDPDSVTVPAAVNRGDELGLIARYHTRYDYELDVTLYGENAFCSGVVRNLSIGGFFVETPQALPVGELCQFDLALPSETLWCTGRVCWVRARNRVHRAGMGIEFQDISDQMREALGGTVNLLAHLAGQGETSSTRAEGQQ